MNEGICPIEAITNEPSRDAFTDKIATSFRANSINKDIDPKRGGEGAIPINQHGRYNVYTQFRYSVDLNR